MKRILLAALCITQLLDASSQKLQPGLKIGAAFPDLKNGTGSDYSSRMAPFGGVSVSQKLSASFRLQEELNYSPQGGRKTGMQPVTTANFPALNIPEDTTLFASYKDELRIAYIELPVLLQLYVERPQQDDRKIFYFINLGPSVALMLNARHVTKGSSLLYADEQGSLPLRTADGLLYPEQSFNSKTDISNEYRKFNASLVGAIGTGYNFSGQKFFLEARFTRGLARVTTGAREKYNTASLVLTAGYVYSFE